MRIQQEQDRADKHRLPRNAEFLDPVTGAKPVDDFKLPFQAIDIIFNHKNIWANLQDQNPQNIFYHIHDEEQWLPLISDPIGRSPHPRERDGELDAEASKGKKGKGDNNRERDLKMKGDYMKPFASFYDPKAMEEPLTLREVEKITKKILKEIEIAMR
jgi:hypothetical protein